VSLSLDVETSEYTLRKKGTKAVTGAVPFQKVHFCIQRLHIGTLVVHISTWNIHISSWNGHIST